MIHTAGSLISISHHKNVSVMKNPFFVLAFLGFSVTASAQFEIKSNPIALLFEVGVVSLEYSNLKDWGGQLDIYAANDGGVVFGSAKYYLIPKYGADRFHVGAFLGKTFSDDNDNAGVGFLAGYKVMSKKRFFFEAALGIGRAFGSDNDIDAIPYANLNIGYRFLSAKNKSKVPAN